MLRLFITLPFLAALIIFTVYNQEVVTLSVPGGYSRQSSLAVLVMIVAVVFFLIGGLVVWFAELRQRRRARRAEQAVRGLEAQLAEARQQLARSQAELQVATRSAPQGGLAVGSDLTPAPYALQTYPPSIV